MRTAKEGLGAAAAMVAAGAAFGTLLRATIEATFPANPGALPWATFGINLTGSFLLGLLIQTLAQLGQDAKRNRRIRLAGGTGILGGFTTYSTFLLEIVNLTELGQVISALFYTGISLFSGVFLAALGMTVADRLTPRQGGGGTADS